MLINARCPHCDADHELSDKLKGQTIIWPKCDTSFEVVAAEPRIETKNYGLASEFEQTGFEAEGDGPRKPKLRLTDGKISLILPPPPREKWAPPKSKKEDEKFPEFDHDSRDVEDFLERERHADDYGWLLVVGLIIVILLVFFFLAWFTYLIFRS